MIGSTSAFAQTTVPDTFKLGKQVAALGKPTGWRKQINDKWSSSPGRIPYADPDYNNPLYEKYSIGDENMFQMKVMEVTVMQKPYYLLMIYYTKGYYKDKVKNTDWTTYSEVDYYVFDKKDLKNLVPDTVKFGVKYGANLHFVYTGTFSYAQETTIPHKLDEHIRWNVAVDHSKDTTEQAYFQFALYPKQDNRGKFMRFSTGLNYAETGDQPVVPDLDIFNSQFYEVPFETFRLFSRGK